MKIRLATIYDIEHIERVIKSAYDEFKNSYSFKDLGFKYSKQATIVKLLDRIRSNLHDVFIVVKDEKVIGFFVVICYSQNIFCDQHFSIVEAVQMDQSLGKIVKSKIMINIINFVEDYSNKLGVDFIQYNIDDSSGVSSFLDKNRYKICEKIYIKNIKKESE